MGIFRRGDISSMLIIDRTSTDMTGSVLRSFAMEELLCRQIGQGAPAAIHLWRHPKAFVMGLRDRRLPYAEQAAAWLTSQGYSVAVRNSGGAAVPLDSGVLNISLLLPNVDSGINLHDDFTAMADLIREALQSFNTQVKKGEIKGSYCPGEFDLSIGGMKFCGIAQRRQTKAYSVQAFVVVEGKGEERAGLAKQFYDIASGGTKLEEFPAIQNERVASLHELLGIPSIEMFIASLNAVAVLSENRHYPDHLLPTPSEIDEMAMQLKLRYDS